MVLTKKHKQKHMQKHLIMTNGFIVLNRPFSPMSEIVADFISVLILEALGQDFDKIGNADFTL